MVLKAYTIINPTLKIKDKFCTYIPINKIMFIVKGSLSYIYYL